MPPSNQSIGDPGAAASSAQFERRVHTKVTRACRLMPLLCVCFMAAFLDRVNVGVAKLTMLAHLGLSQTAYATGAGIFFIGYFFFEVPSKQVRGIGVRMALGASPSLMLRSVLQGAARRVAFGVAIGWAGAWATSSIVQSFVFGVEPTDALVYLAVAGFLVVVSLAAAFVPAVRAARVDPLTALRCE